MIVVQLYEYIFKNHQIVMDGMDGWVEFIHFNKTVLKIWQTRFKKKKGNDHFSPYNVRNYILIKIPKLQTIKEIINKINNLGQLDLSKI